MNGSVVSMLDKPKHDQIREKTKQLKKIFYHGDPLTDLEVDIERMYISDKMEKYQTYQKRKSMRYKVRWSISDLNRY